MLQQEPLEFFRAAIGHRVGDIVRQAFVNDEFAAGKLVPDQLVVPITGLETFHAVDRLDSRLCPIRDASAVALRVGIDRRIAKQVYSKSA